MTLKEIRKLSPDEKIYKIAEYCGAKWYRLVPSDDYERSLSFDDLNMNGSGLSFANGDEKVVQIHSLPHYLSDLNAIHKAVEETIEPERYPFYDHVLQRVMGGEFAFTSRATALQRAEALIEVMEDKNNA